MNKTFVGKISSSNNHDFKSCFLYTWVINVLNMWIQIIFDTEKLILHVLSL